MDAWDLEQRTPIEHRWLGLDRRYIAPLLLVIGVWLLWSVVMPAIDESITRDEIPAGTTAKLAGGVTFMPAEGWVYAGPPTPGTPTLELYEEGVKFTIHSGSFSGTSRELLAIETKRHDDFRFEGAVRAFPLSGGVVGAAREIRGPASLGGLFAFSHGGQGVTVFTDGPPNLVRQQTTAIATMIASIQFPSEGSEE